MHNMLAMPVGKKQKRNFSTIVQNHFRFLQENFKIILFHYDGKLDCWQDLEWNSKAIHVFLHPAAVVSIYVYIFFWDEDLGMQHFNPKRYSWYINSHMVEYCSSVILKLYIRSFKLLFKNQKNKQIIFGTDIMLWHVMCRYLDITKTEGLEISQPTLDLNSTGIHHRITIRTREQKFHR
ncbi:hypothetical protein HanPI659440_Chr17g0688631 [Helianthus annuus]|nr:hypothetical protein HanPI659440_Chr17g0688631 [Helianthus annuus]